ncbi:hypothetical protein G7Y89_g449 [Cudoniella acicularis]|uniref:FAD-binding domain-containing protein n=1 Tax=Cudoniella acicularis TaxID=354080 RepID=A0A8H4RX78_9HELO|nr:hypothetical protein G7Y89_g449 [Cudoniella acicularis]
MWHLKKVTAIFEDGREESADLILGCDGIHSAVRTKYVEPSRVPIYTNVAVAYSVIDGNGLSLPPHFHQTAMNSGRFGSLLTSYVDPDHSKIYLGAVMSMPEEKDKHGWRMPPQGESTGLAIEDGVLLARILSSHSGSEEVDIERAFRMYEKTRRPRIDRSYKEAVMRWESVKDKGWFLQKLIEWLMWVILWWKMSDFEKIVIFPTPGFEVWERTGWFTVRTSCEGSNPFYPLKKTLTSFLSLIRESKQTCVSETSTQFKMHLIKALFLAALTPLSLASALPRTTTTPTIRQIYTFGPNTFIENIAVRSNSQLLLTSLSVPTLFTLNPLLPTPNASIIHTFPTNTSLSGITEISPDNFVVVTGIWDLATARATLGSLSIWTVDFSSSPNSNSESPVVKNVANVTQSTILNGIVSIPSTPLVLAADSAIGAVWVINTLTGTSSTSFSSPLFQPGNASTLGQNLGINGLKIHSSYLYFTNSAQGIFGRVKINRGGEKVGEIEVLANVSVATSGLYVDDFAIREGSEEGTAWIATHPSQVVKVSLKDGTQEVIANASLLLNPTSAAFGRGSAGQEKTLYVTNGGEFSGSGLVNEGVVAIDTT